MVMRQQMMLQQQMLLQQQAALQAQQIMQKAMKTPTGVRNISSIVIRII